MTEKLDFDISLEGTQASKVFMEPVFRADSIDGNFLVMGNVKGGSKKIKYRSAMEGILQKYVGCGFNPLTVTDFTEKEIFVKDMQGDVKYCWSDFSDVLWKSVYDTKGDWANISGTDIGKIMTQMYTTGVSQDLNRLAYFGNTSSSDSTYDLVDGVWTVVYPREVSAGRCGYYDINTNSAPGAGDATTWLKAVWDAQKLALYGLAPSAKVINVSRSVYDGFRSDIENSTNFNYGMKTLIDGVERIYFRGTEVVNNPTWDSWAVASGSTSISHRIELTARFNKVLLTPSMDGIDYTFDAWYDKKDEYVYIKSRPRVGFDIIHGSLVSVGYNIA